MRKRKPRVYKQRPVVERPEPGSFKTMPADRVRQASFALGADPEDVSDEEREALNEFIELGGNVWGL